MVVSDGTIIKQITFAVQSQADIYFVRTTDKTQFNAKLELNAGI